MRRRFGLSGHSIVNTFERAMVRWAGYHVAAAVGLAGVAVIVGGLWVLGRARVRGRR